jgi:hypothetical protein
MNELRPTPSRGIRLLWWFGIYFAAQLPLIPWGYHLNWHLWPLFPMAMEWGFIGLVSWLVPRSVFEAGGNQNTAQILQICIWWVAIILPWATYVTHLIWTLCIRTRRSFLILIWILIGIVLLNIASCAYLFHAPPQ